jgi:hypothetical protein
MHGISTHENKSTSANHRRSRRAWCAAVPSSVLRDCRGAASLTQTLILLSAVALLAFAGYQALGAATSESARCAGDAVEALSPVQCKDGEAQPASVAQPSPPPEAPRADGGDSDAPEIDLKKELLDLFLDITGLNDIKDCVLKGDPLACVMAIASASPIKGIAIGVKLAKNAKRIQNLIERLGAARKADKAKDQQKKAEEAKDQQKKADEAKDEGKNADKCGAAPGKGKGKGGGADQPLAANAMAAPSGKPKRPPKAPLNCGEVGTYTELNKKAAKPNDLERDHVPSHAAMVEAAKALPELSGATAKQLKCVENQLRNRALTIAIPRGVHRDHSPTCGSRNKPLKGKDAKDLSGAAARDLDAIQAQLDKAAQYFPGGGWAKCAQEYREAAKKVRAQDHGSLIKTIISECPP